MRRYHRVAMRGGDSVDTSAGREASARLYNGGIESY